MENFSTTNNKEWLTPKELEAEYGISETHQYKLRMKKNYTKEARAIKPPIPFVKICKRITYNRAKINEWLLSLQVGV